MMFFHLVRMKKNKGCLHEKEKYTYSDKLQMGEFWIEGMQSIVAGKNHSSIREDFKSKIITP